MIHDLLYAVYSYSQLRFPYNFKKLIKFQDESLFDWTNHAIKPKYYKEAVLEGVFVIIYFWLGDLSYEDKSDLPDDLVNSFTVYSAHEANWYDIGRISHEMGSPAKIAGVSLGLGQRIHLNEFLRLLPYISRMEVHTNRYYKKVSPSWLFRCRTGYNMENIMERLVNKGFLDKRQLEFYIVPGTAFSKIILAKLLASGEPYDL